MSPAGTDASEDRAAISDLERGRDAYRLRKWDDAFRLLSAADSEAPLAAADLESLAWSGMLTHREPQSAVAWERCYAAWQEAGESARGARAALWLCMFALSRGEQGQATGWHARAARLVGDLDCVERGYLLIPSFYKHRTAGDLAPARETAAEVVAIGDRFGDADLSALARQQLGDTLLSLGRIDEGLSQLDDAMLSVVSGELSPIFTGMIYCGVIGGCHRIFAFDRVGEWTAALSAWCDSQPQMVAFTGSCLVRRAEIKQLQGDWAGAIEEAKRAADRLPTAVETGVAGAAYYQEAEVHRLRGEFAAAEESYRQAGELAGETQPGLALLRLAQGEVNVAAKAIRRALSVADDPLDRMRYLPAAVEILIAAGAMEEARAAHDEIEQIAEANGTPVLLAIAARTRAEMLLAEGDLRAACAALRSAVAAWQPLGARHAVALLRSRLARAYDELGDAEGARLELGAAKRIFDELGAKHDLSLLERDVSDKASPRHGLTKRELEVLQRLAAGDTNKAIAKKLFVSERTVDRHVSNILTKLDVPTRSAATAFAFRERLLDHLPSG